MILVKERSRKSSIGHSQKIDHHAMNPNIGRSPGPMYNTSCSSINIKTATKFGNEKKFTDVDKAPVAPKPNKYNPNYD